MKLNQKGGMALPVALIISGVLAGAAYYSSQHSGMASKAVYTDVDKSRVADTLEKHLNTKVAELKFRIDDILNWPEINPEHSLKSILRPKLLSNENFKCYPNPDFTNPKYQVIKDLDSSSAVIFTCRELTLNNKLGYLLEARLQTRGKALSHSKKAFVPAKIPIGYITLTRNNPTRDNRFLTPYIESGPLKKDMPVYLHDKIITDSKSFVHITMLDDTILNLSPNSIFQIDEFKFRETITQTKRNGIYNLIRGFLRANFNKHSQNQLIIKTQTASMGIRGTTLTVWTGESKERPATTFTLLEGKIELLEADGTPFNPPRFMDADNDDLKKGETPTFTNIHSSATDAKEINLETGPITQKEVNLYNVFGNAQYIKKASDEELKVKINDATSLNKASINEVFETSDTWQKQILATAIRPGQLFIAAQGGKKTRTAGKKSKIATASKKKRTASQKNSTAGKKINTASSSKKTTSKRKKCRFFCKIKKAAKKVFSSF